MKKTILFACVIAAVMTSCGNRKCNCTCSECNGDNREAVEAAAAKAARGEYKIADRAQTDISNYPVDEEGYIGRCDGTTRKGWRG